MKGHSEYSGLWRIIQLFYEYDPKYNQKSYRDYMESKCAYLWQTYNDPVLFTSEWQNYVNLRD